MSFTRPPSGKSVPTAPTGDTVAAYPTYAQAQAAVGHLASQHFAVEALTIVGSNLQSVERITGRLSYSRVALAGAMSGAWFGLFVGLLLSMFGGQGVISGIGMISAGVGAGCGLLFSMLSYRFTRGRRDFTSASQIVAAQYAVLCAPAAAAEARRLLMASPVGAGALGGAGYGTTMAAPLAPGAVGQQVPGSANPSGPAATGAQTARAIDSRWVTADGKPRYGALAADVPNAPLPANAPTQVEAQATPAGAGGAAPPGPPTDPFAPPPPPPQAR